MMAGMAQTSGQGTEEVPVTRGERVAGVAGVVCGVLIILVCVDLASGGRVSGALSRRPAAAAGADEGGCPGGCP